MPKRTTEVVPPFLAARVLYMGPRWHSTCDGPYQELSQNVHDNGHDEKRQPYFNQSAEINITCGFTEFICDYAGHGIAGSEQRLRDLGSIADYHGDGHRFAECAAKAQNDSAQDTGARIAPEAGENHLLDAGSQ